ncbi:hypothetical protein PRK78_003081 [Emydomyces testavorans]|uniref:N-acetyltransferase domain-containing protein n=1 Tax=Emydomyces testavorans TaxID=2070801 RepID=A0AAF0IK90_9EURO|nr:hypothetical protein PRK78_003081 [Emydomyces testavorans]
MKLRPELEDENTRYLSGGAPPHPFRVILPPRESLPIIRTTRLCLRPLTRDDAQAIFDAKSRETPQTWLMMKSKPWTSIDETYAWIDRKVFEKPASAAGRSFQYVVVLGHDPRGAIVGSIGMNQVHPVPNIGYATDEGYRGMGYASEALGGFMDAWWGLARREDEEGEKEERSEDWDGTERVFATVNKNNVASLKILARNGFRVYFERTMADGETVCCAAAEKPEK